MNIALLLEVIQLAASVIKNQTGPRTDGTINEAVALARIVAAGRQAYLERIGEPLDESAIKAQERIQ